MELDLRLVKICRDSFVLLRAYSLGIEVTRQDFFEKSAILSYSNTCTSYIIFMDNYFLFGELKNETLNQKIYRIVHCV